MKRLIAAVFDGNSPLFFFLALMLCLVGLMNISVAFFGAVSLSQFAFQEILNFALTGIGFLAAAVALFWIGTKTTGKKDAKNEWLVLSPLASVIFLGIFLGFIAVFFPIQTMEGIFGKEAGRAIFFRILTISSICIISFGFVGMAASLFAVKAYRKAISNKKHSQKMIK